MKGLPVMVAVSVLFGALSAGILGWIGGIVVALAVLIAWYPFNLRSGTSGLFKANLNSYFAFRRQGLAVDDALRAMVTARYSFAFQQAKKDMALEELTRIPQEGREKLRVIQAVIAVFMVEHGVPPPPELTERYYEEIATLYVEIGARYGVVTE